MRVLARVHEMVRGRVSREASADMFWKRKANVSTAGPRAEREGRRKRRSRAEFSSRRRAMGDVIKFPGCLGAVDLISAKQAAGTIFLFVGQLKRKIHSVRVDRWETSMPG